MFILNNSINYDLLLLLYSIVVIFFLAILLIVLSSLVNFFLYNSIELEVLYEKLSVYECGFDAFDDIQLKFDVQFFLVALLFIIFDLEIVFLYPWLLVFSLTNIFPISIFLFLIILAIGFVYEWLLGVLYIN